MTTRCLMLTVSRTTELDPDESEFRALPQSVRRRVAEAVQSRLQTTVTGLLLSSVGLHATLLALSEHETAFRAATGQRIRLRVTGYAETEEALPQTEARVALYEQHGIETLDSLIAVTAKCHAAMQQADHGSD